MRKKEKENFLLTNYFWQRLREFSLLNNRVEQQEKKKSNTKEEEINSFIINPMNRILCIVRGDGGML